MDWKDIKEALPIVLVALVWIMSQLFGKKEKDEEPKSFEPVTQDSSQEDVIFVEEEIRRKIAQRQENASKEAEVTPLNEPVLSMNQEVEPEVEMPSWQKQLHEKEHHLAASKKAMELAYQQAKKTTSSYSKKPPAQPSVLQTAMSSSSMNKLPLLKEPQMLRQAFLYAEVLGPPLGARKGQNSFQSSFWSLYD